RYWSSTQYVSSAFGYMLDLNNGSAVSYLEKATALPVRCLRDNIVKRAPTVSNVSIPTATMTATTAVGTATATIDGGSPISERGLCWNTTGNPDINSTKLALSQGTGVFSGTLTGLTEGPTYYVRAYAINDEGVSYSPVVSSFKICPTSFAITHTAGVGGAPVSKSVTYHSISSGISGSAACWLTQNLGADQQPTAVNDATEASSGWYWQFNRLRGYQYLSSRNPATAWISSISESSDWTVANDPCTQLLGSGWRLPTRLEWQYADAPPQNWTSAASAFASELRLHSAGVLAGGNGVLDSRGGYGRYWSSTQYANTSYGYILDLYGGSAESYLDKATALPVRCIRK
ncbi:hypothetical protein, partial [Arcticibacter tournemirensis]